MRAEREEYHAIAGPMAGEWRDMMEGYFERVARPGARVGAVDERRGRNPLV